MLVREAGAALDGQPTDPLTYGWPDALLGS